MIDWSRLAGLAKKARKGETGRPPYDPLSMLKKGTLLDATIAAATHNPPSRAAWMKAPVSFAAFCSCPPGSAKARWPTGSSAATSAPSMPDRGYEKKARRERLKAEGIKDRIMHRRHRYMPELPYWQKRRNDLIARRHAPVEAVFSALKRLYGGARTRCHSLAANAAGYTAFATVCNLRRASMHPAT
ncbi:MAG: transposase [Parvibaculum sp.]|nr:transposase [Parvibaculum sp.]